MQRAAGAPQFGPDQPGPLPQERQVALVELVDNVVPRAVGVDVGVQAVRRAHLGGDLGVRDVLVGARPAGHPQAHEGVFGVRDDHRRYAVDRAPAPAPTRFR